MKVQFVQWAQCTSAKNVIQVGLFQGKNQFHGCNAGVNGYCHLDLGTYYYHSHKILSAYGLDKKTLAELKEIISG